METGKKNCTKPIPLPMGVIREALEIDLASKSGLRWKVRPRHHFKRENDWKSWNAQFAGKDAGCKKHMRKSYFQLAIAGVYYRCHRIVFALATGVDAGSAGLDHIDGNGLNNNPSNLRLANQTQNGWNRGPNRNNTSGKKGVTQRKDSKKWRALIVVNGVRKYLGSFDSADEASAAYESAAREFFGQFYRECKAQ
jgi:hypothetical protein